MEKLDYLNTSHYFRNSAIMWLLFGVILSAVSSLQILFGIFASSEVFSYGKIVPMMSNSLIFGAILSYFLGIVFYELHSLPVDKQKFYFLGRAALILHQFNLIFGLLTVMVGKNDGRIYGEMNFIADNLFMLVFTIIAVITLVHVKQYGKFTGIYQMIVFTLAGMMASFFVGNFGFPNSPITVVPPTSGYQDAITQGLYKTAILVFFVGMPLVTIFTSLMKNHFQISDEEWNAIPYLFFLLLLTSVSGGVGLFHSPYQNFWTSIGNYVYSAINILFLGYMYYLHKVYNESEGEKNLLFSFAGIILSIFFLINAIVSIPVVYEYLQYTSLDALVIYNKVLYLLLPLMLLYNVYINGMLRSIPALLSIIVLVIALGVFLSYGVESVMQSLAIFSIKDGKLVNTDWAKILEGTSFVHYIKLVFDLLYFISVMILINLSIQNKTGTKEA